MCPCTVRAMWCPSVCLWIGSFPQWGNLKIVDATTEPASLVPYTALTGYGVLEVLNLKIQAIESFPSCSTYVVNICMCRQKGKSGGCKGNKGYKAFLFSTLALKHEQSPLSSSNIAVLRYIRYSVSLRQRWRNRDLFLKEHICFPLPCQKTRSRIEKNT